MYISPTIGLCHAEEEKYLENVYLKMFVAGFTHYRMLKLFQEYFFKILQISWPFAKVIRYLFEELKRGN